MAGKAANKARPKKVVRVRYNGVVLTNDCTALQCVTLPKMHVDRHMFSVGDRVEVTVKLLKRKA